MARLVDVRSEIVAKPEGPATDEQAHPFEAFPLVPEELVADDVVEWGFDDEDFWEALDLMETSYKMMSGLLTGSACKMSPGRCRVIENHCCDIKQFLDEFLVGAA